MPRQGKPGTIRGEEHVARRIAMERELRGWSYDKLAFQLTSAGRPTDQATVYKMEKGKPRRKVTVDELVAFSDIFGLSVDQLLSDPDVAAETHALRDFERYVRASQAAAAAVAKANEAADRVLRSVEQSKRAEAVVRAVVKERYTDDKVAQLVAQKLTHPHNVRKARKSR